VYFQGVTAFAGGVGESRYISNIFNDANAQLIHCERIVNLSPFNVFPLKLFPLKLLLSK
jgi:hypothetical protein